MEPIYGGRVVLITGARRGVGLMLTRHFLAHGARVIGVNRERDDKPLDNYTGLEVDIRNADSVVKAFEDIRRQFHRVDILINNAAVLTSQYTAIMPVVAARNMLDTNLFGGFVVAREAAKLMMRNKWGRIINIGSMATSLEPIGDSVYAATKAGLCTLANVMAKELAAFNVTCNTLGITAIETDMLSQLPREKIDRVIAGLPIPRYAVADDILNVVDFFAAERSGYITAQTVFLGGVN